MRISDWSSDVCSSDLFATVHVGQPDIQQDQVVMGVVHGGQPVGGGGRLGGREFLVQLQLLGQGRPERLVVVDKENLASARHAAYRAAGSIPPTGSASGLQGVRLSPGRAGAG